VVMAQVAPIDVDPPAQKLENSIAVLPFTNISEDPANAYFCDGISEEILNTLACFQGLNVIGRISSSAFKGSEYRIPAITALLGVRHVLQGSVRKYENQLRIATRLLDESGVQVWATTFDRELSNVFDIQSEIAQAVATTVAAQLAPAPPKTYVPDVAAYDAFLRGRDRLHKRDIPAAIEALERAVEIDPQFAAAWAELAIARTVGIGTEDLGRAREYIDKALALEPRPVRARAALGLWLMQQVPPDLAGAEAQLENVLAQDPNMSDALLWLSNALRGQGRNDEAFEFLQRGTRIDPLHPSITNNLAGEWRRRGESDRAWKVLRQQLQAPEPSFPVALAARDLARVTGRLVELHEIAQRMSLEGIAPNHFSIALSHALVGDWAKAEYWLERTIQDYPQLQYAPLYRSILPQWQGDRVEALRRFREIVASGTERLKALSIVPLWYGALAARAGDYAAAIETLQPLMVADNPASSPTVPSAPELSPPQALAWAYLNNGDRDEAAQLLEGLERACAPERLSMTHSSHELYQCAEIAVLRGDLAAALDRFERAVTAGWREYYLRVNDPYWAPLRDDPRYQALMAEVKADVDRQAAEIARRDAEEDFIAKLDAARAARASAKTR
jgi:TolB-like protein/Flp pilus assembly protein TadD